MWCYLFFNFESSHDWDWVDSFCLRCKNQMYVHYLWNLEDESMNIIMPGAIFKVISDRFVLLFLILQDTDRSFEWYCSKLGIWAFFLFWLWELMASWFLSQIIHHLSCQSYTSRCTLWWSVWMISRPWLTPMLIPPF